MTNIKMDPDIESLLKENYVDIPKNIGDLLGWYEIKLISGIDVNLFDVWTKIGVPTDKIEWFRRNPKMEWSQKFRYEAACLKLKRYEEIKNILKYFYDKYKNGSI